MAIRKKSGNSILRAVFVGVSILCQVLWLLMLMLWLNEYSVWISFAVRVLALAVVLRLYSRHTTSAMKLPWIMLIMAFPVMGITLYLLIISFGDLGSHGRRMKRAALRLAPQLCQDPDVLRQAAQSEPMLRGCREYLWQQCASPVYGNTAVTYHPQAVRAFEELKRDLERAEKFIFMEYFIVSHDSCFREILQILRAKVRQGVEVRLMYDDVGSVGKVNFRFAWELREMGIRCRVFNPALPVLNLFMNHRDHRKITVIDGTVAFTGGYNLADEYFDRTRPYGHWKDTGIRLEGAAVRSLTASFLQMWSAGYPGEEDISPYFPPAEPVEASGFVQPFGDDPLERERAAENLLLQLAFRAEKSLYFMTPYLIITEEMNRALGLAAKRGADVRIITPGIPDKKAVFAMTRSYYGELVSQGVRIFEYSPGFIHAKQCVCDGTAAVIGTSNLDYRSLYLHFENNVLLSGCPAVDRMSRDFEDTFALCREVTGDYRTGRRRMLMLWQCLLRLFAPMV